MQHPTASASCRHIAGPTAGLSKWGAPPRQAPGVSPTPSGSASTAGNCRAQGGAHPAKRPARVDALSDGPPGSHPPQRQGLRARQLGRHSQGRRPHHNLRARWARWLDRHAHQAKCLPCHNRGLTPSIQQPASPQASSRARGTTRIPATAMAGLAAGPPFRARLRYRGPPAAPATCGSNQQARQGGAAAGQSRQGLGGRAANTECRRGRKARVEGKAAGAKRGSQKQGKKGGGGEGKVNGQGG